MSDEAYESVVVCIKAAHDHIGTSWLWEWSMPALFDALVEYYATMPDDPQGWFKRQQAAAIAARVSVDNTGDTTAPETANRALGERADQ